MKNLFLIGFMGAGKSSVSAGLGRMLGREVVEMDQRIAAQEGMSIPELFAQKGEPYFRACETALLKSFAQGAPRIVSCGGGVPLREENVVAMRESGTVVLLTASPEVILERVKDSDERPLLQGHKDVSYIAVLMEQRRPRYEAAADITVDTSQLNIEEVCRQVLRQVTER
jgi:shikimate kinase